MLRSRLVRNCLTLAAIVAVMWVLIGQRDELYEALTELSVVGVILGLASAIGAVAAAGWAWMVILGGTGSTLGPVAGYKVYLVGQLGKYIPGGIWPVLLQVELAAEQGVPRRRTATATLVLWVVAVASGAAVGAVALLFLPEVRSRHAWWLVPCALFGCLLLYPPLLNRLLRLGLSRVTSADIEQDPVRARVVVSAFAVVVLSWFCYGAHVAVLAKDFGASGDGLIPTAIGSYSIAWVAGFLVIVMPSGAGIREAILVLALQPVLPASEALALAVVSRLLVTAVDAGTGGAAVLASGIDRLRRVRERARSAPIDTATPV